MFTKMWILRVIYIVVVLFIALYHHGMTLQPQFMHLAQIWAKFQDEMVMLSVLSNFLLNLEAFLKVPYSVECSYQ